MKRSMKAVRKRISKLSKTLWPKKDSQDKPLPGPSDKRNQYDSARIGNLSGDVKDGHPVPSSPAMAAALRESQQVMGGSSADKAEESMRRRQRNKQDRDNAKALAALQRNLNLS